MHHKQSLEMVDESVNKKVKKMMMMMMVTVMNVV